MRRYSRQGKGATKAVAPLRSTKVRQPKEAPVIARRYVVPDDVETTYRPGPGLYVDPAAAATLRLPSVKVESTMPPVPVKYTGELAEREVAAQKELAKKRKQVAPMANKMGYQYIGDAPPEVIRTLGRKT